VISQPTDPSFVPSCFGFQSPKLARLS
jgi:hypothetical protein